MTAARILVIKLGALGDFVQAFAAFAAIRAHHPGAAITLLTTPAFVDLARQSPWFDAVWGDGRPAWTDLAALWRLAWRLRGGGFDRVYDLQTSPRTARYRRVLRTDTEWSGVAAGASHRYVDPARATLHVVERQRRQLAVAGIAALPMPELGWLGADADAALPPLPPRFVLLVPGASPHRPGKRWPIQHYAALAATLGRPAVILGGVAEHPLAEAIVAAAPGSLDLTGRTPLASLAALGRRADAAVGNDTGPMHLLAATGCPTLVLFGADSEPAFCAPLGPRVSVLRRVPLRGLGVAEVRALVDEVLRPPHRAT